MAEGIAGYGQNGPEDATNDFNVRQRQIKNLLSKISTAKVVTVVGVAGGGLNPPGTVSVQPLVNMQDGIGNTQEHGVVEGIPFWRYQGGLNAIIADPKVGDVGLLVCADRDINAVKATRKVSNPGSARQFSIADGIYLGGLLNPTPDQYVWFTEVGMIVVDKNENMIVLDESGILLSPLGDGTTSIALTRGKITISADELVLHGRNKTTFDAGGTGFVYQPAQIDTYTQGVPSTSHPPMPPEVPT